MRKMGGELSSNTYTHTIVIIPKIMVGGGLIDLLSIAVKISNTDNMKHYTSTIPLDLAEKLQKKGMPLITSVSISIVEDKPVVDENGEQWYRPSYAEVFDWLTNQRILIDISWARFFRKCGWYVDNYLKHRMHCGVEKTWHEAADAAIEKALELI